MFENVDAGRRRVMRAIRSKDTGPELALRKLLHHSGYRYRLHRRDLPGTPDTVFPARRAAILIHGCFWHQHSECRHGRVPATRQSYWLPKLARNKERDQQTSMRLEAAGWRHIVIWECELIDLPAVLQKVCAFLGPPGADGVGKPSLERQHSPRRNTDGRNNGRRNPRASNKVRDEADT